MSYLKAKHLSDLLVSKGLTISVAESCTGGSLSSSLTSISGASSYFNCGFITYSNQSKIDMLLKKVDILKLKNSKIQNLSEGEKQRISIIRALVNTRTSSCSTDWRSEQEYIREL